MAILLDRRVIVSERLAVGGDGRLEERSQSLDVGQTRELQVDPVTWRRGVGDSGVLAETLSHSLPAGRGDS